MNLIILVLDNGGSYIGYKYVLFSIFG